MARLTITKAYTRHYRDNDSRKAYVEWSDGSRTEGTAELYYDIMIPVGTDISPLDMYLPFVVNESLPQLARRRQACSFVSYWPGLA